MPIQPATSLFHSLHSRGCFCIPNPWDPGSAVFLRSLGFRALATTSAGFGFSRALPDRASALPRDLVLAHIAEIVAAVPDLPVNADFQSGYADTPEALAESVRLCIATGVAGLSIEDATDDPARPLYELPEALDRLRAACHAIDASNSGVLLTARAECFLVNPTHPDNLRESIRRLEAYAAAGADVLFAPGAATRDHIRTIVRAVAPKPVNILMSAPSPEGLTLADLEDLGVRRVSLGSALARAAWTGFINAARPLASRGDFSGLQGLTPFAELNNLFAANAADSHTAARNHAP